MPDVSSETAAPEPCPCVAQSCHTCRLERRALYRVAVGARALLDHVDRGSQLSQVALDSLREELDRLEDALEATCAAPDTRLFA